MKKIDHMKTKNAAIYEKKFTKDNKKVRDHCHFTGKYRGAAHSKCNMNYKITKDIPIVFHKASYDSHFIIKELANEFEGELECLGENTEKSITYSVKFGKKITKRDKNGSEKIVNIPYRLKFIDSYRFMSTSLSKLVNNLSDGLHKNKCRNCKSRLDYVKAEESRLIFRCSGCNRSHHEDVHNDLINRFSSTYNFCQEDINMFTLLLRKGVYPQEYIDSWERPDETELPSKEKFYSCLNVKNITDTRREYLENLK